MTLSSLNASVQARLAEAQPLFPQLGLVPRRDFFCRWVGGDLGMCLGQRARPGLKGNNNVNDRQYDPQKPPGAIQNQ